MKGVKIKKKESEFENVKHRKEVVNLVRKNKKETGVPVSVFFDKAAIKELDRIKAKEV